MSNPPSAALPKTFHTLIEMLAHRAAANRDQVAFTYADQPHTFAELWTDINRFGAHLLRLGVSPGERVVLALPNSAEFFSAFYGVQRAGGIAVPLFPGSGPARVFSIAEMCGAKIVVAPSGIPEKQLAGFKAMGKARGLHVITVSEGEAEFVNEDIFPLVRPEDIAFIQYTSGSTGNPKGVQLSHDNLITNVVQMIAGMQITAREVFVSWLPVYHDMGLILKTMAPFYLAAQTHLLPTNLRDVRPWLRAIQTHQATFTAAPDFAYRLCLRHTTPGDYDLTSLRVALNAAEPVRAQTMRDFETAFGLQDVMVAGYGLAEATVGVSMWPPQTPARVDARGFVSVGPPFPKVELQIVKDGEPAASGVVGEIAIRSQANSRGYLGNPEATAKLVWRDGYFLSGDLGHLDADGYLYIVSRKKNIIKRSGVTIAPQEVEEAVDAQPGVRYSAAVGVDRGRFEGEQVYVFAEIRDGETLPEDALHDLALEMVAHIYARMGFRPGRVYLLKPRSIPLTHNGKIQHAQLKMQYLDGRLRNSGAILFPEF